MCCNFIEIHVLSDMYSDEDSYSDGDYEDVNNDVAWEKYGMGTGKLFTNTYLMPPPPIWITMHTYAFLLSFHIEKYLMPVM